MPRHLAAGLAALSLLAVAAPAAFAAAPGDRAAARQIRQATIDLGVAAVAQKPAIEAALRQFRDNPVCANAIKGAPDEAVAALAFEYVLPAVIEIEIAPLQPALHAFAAKLDTLAIPDKTLRSGRAAWRVYADLFGRIPAPPADLCAPLDAWAKAGYPDAGRPKIEDPVLAEALKNDSRFDRLDSKLDRAGKRLRELGVSRKVVDWWTGEALFEGLEPDEDLLPELGG
jgi:hypothetical protein